MLEHLHMACLPGAAVKAKYMMSSFFSNEGLICFLYFISSGEKNVFSSINIYNDGESCILKIYCNEVTKTHTKTPLEMLQERWQELHCAEGDQRFAAAQHLFLGPH